MDLTPWTCQVLCLPGHLALCSGSARVALGCESSRSNGGSGRPSAEQHANHMGHLASGSCVARPPTTVKPASGTVMPAIGVEAVTPRLGILNGAFAWP